MKESRQTTSDLGVCQLFQASNMAVLGVQIVITMVMASIMTKIGPFMSFARWILTSSGLVRYMHPSDEELKPMAIVPLLTKITDSSHI